MLVRGATVLGLLVAGVCVAAGACESEVTKSSSVTAASSTASHGGGGTNGAGGFGGASGGLGVGGCEVNCEAMYASGIEPLAALEHCMYCEACYDVCNPSGYCLKGGAETGCSMSFQDCETCAYSTCSWTMDGGGECGAEYQACNDNEDCFFLQNCRDTCN